MVIINSLEQHVEIVPKDMKEGSALYKPISSFAPMIIKEFREFPGVDIEKPF